MLLPDFKAAGSVFVLCDSEYSGQPEEIKVIIHDVQTISADEENKKGLFTLSDPFCLTLVNDSYS